MSENDEVVAVDDLDALEFAGADFIGVEPADAARKLGAVNVADAHDIAPGEVAAAPGHAGRQEALALVAQGVARAVVHPQGAFGVMKKSDAPLAALETGGTRDKKSPFVLAAEDVGEDALFLPEAISIGMPVRAAIPAARSLASMPPTAVALAVPPASFWMSASIFPTTGIVLGFFLPKFFTRPSTVVRMTSRSAGSRQATSAASQSLSPNFSSV